MTKQPKKRSVGFKAWLRHVMLQTFDVVPARELLQARFAQRLAETQSEELVRAIRGKRIISSDFSKHDFDELYCETIFAFNCQLTINHYHNNTNKGPNFIMISGDNQLTIHKNITTDGREFLFGTPALDA